MSRRGWSFNRSRRLVLKLRLRIRIQRMVSQCRLERGGDRCSRLDANEDVGVFFATRLTFLVVDEGVG